MTAGDFYFVRGDECFAVGGAVSGGAETSYSDEWLVDGRPGYPVKATNGSPTWTITGTAAAVGIVAVCNHNVDATKTITMGGDLSTTLTGPALPPNGIPLNPWVAFTEVAGVDSVTLSITSNSASVIIGELIMGKKRTLERAPAPGAKFSQQYGTVRHDAEFNSLMAYDKAVVSRKLTADVMLTDSGLSAVQDWWDSTRGNTRPSLIVPNSNVQDAWLVEFVAFEYEPISKNRNSVSMVFQEFPRSRW